MGRRPPCGRRLADGQGEIALLIVQGGFHRVINARRVLREHCCRHNQHTHERPRILLKTKTFNMFLNNPVFRCPSGTWWIVATTIHRFFAESHGIATRRSISSPTAHYLPETVDNNTTKAELRVRRDAVACSTRHGQEADACCRPFPHLQPNAPCCRRRPYAVRFGGLLVSDHWTSVCM